MQQQHGKERALLRSPQVDLPPVVEDLERAENPKLHRLRDEMNDTDPIRPGRCTVGMRRSLSGCLGDPFRALAVLHAALSEQQTADRRRCSREQRADDERDVVAAGRARRAALSPASSRVSVRAAARLASTASPSAPPIMKAVLTTPEARPASLGLDVAHRGEQDAG